MGRLTICYVCMRTQRDVALVHQVSFGMGSQQEEHSNQFADVCRSHADALPVLATFDDDVLSACLLCMSLHITDGMSAAVH